MASSVPRVKLGSQGLEVSQQGLGTNSLRAGDGTEEGMIALVHHAVDSGVTFLDTADVYGRGESEVLIGKAIKGIREKVQLATKFGFAGVKYKFEIHGDPEYVRKAVEGSLKRLDVDYIDLYYQHRVDPKVPIEITVGEMKRFVEEGKVKYLGLSEASAADIRRAHAVHPITAVQIEWSLFSRDVEEEVIPTCRELGIGIVAYSPLGRGFFAGVTLADIDASDMRKRLPRFSAENFERNKALYDRLAAIASKKHTTAGQIALAWVQFQGKDVVPIPGTTKVKNLDQNLGALSLELTKEDVKEIEDAVPHNEIAGDRYAAAMMQNSFLHAQSPPLSSWTKSKP